jgi:GNAT superfamily N-acetyltransferase
VTMVAPAGGPADPPATQTDLDGLRPMWDAMWRRDLPGIPDDEVVQLSDRYLAEEPVLDLRYLAVRERGRVVAAALLKIDGATALLDAVNTEPEHRGRGHGDALLRTALALAAEAGCDVVALEAAVRDWPRHCYARRGFREVGECWEARAGR